VHAGTTKDSVIMEKLADIMLLLQLNNDIQMCTEGKVTLKNDTEAKHFSKIFYFILFFISFHFISFIYLFCIRLHS